jgi:hypothetical protein
VSIPLLGSDRESRFRSPKIHYQVDSLQEFEQMLTDRTRSQGRGRSTQGDTVIVAETGTKSPVIGSRH